MKKIYEWRVLTEDGLLRLPKERGPSYDRVSVNGYGEFLTQEEAVDALERFRTEHKIGVEREMVLVTIYVDG